jgi:hypothetical protein
LDHQFFIKKTNPLEGLGVDSPKPFGGLVSPKQSLTAGRFPPSRFAANSLKIADVGLFYANQGTKRVPLKWQTIPILSSWNNGGWKNWCKRHGNCQFWVFSMPIMGQKGVLF